ncbi:MAG TPA: hypothetical protein VGO62_14150 [Myxococcota bacterium]
MTRLCAPLCVAIALASASAVAADEVPLDKQKGVRGRVVIAPELLTTPVKLTGPREKALRGTALIRRPLGRPIAPLVEPPPALVVMLEGDGIRDENPEQQKVKIEGQRFLPSSLVMARVANLHVENHQKEDLTLIDDKGGVLGKIPAGGAIDAPLRAGEHELSLAEMPYATASVRVLERGRVLPLKDGEIPLVEISGGEYQLTFFFGAEPLRIQPLPIPEQGLVFIDATVSALKVVEVSLKDASMRIAVPPGREEAP